MRIVRFDVHPVELGEARQGHLLRLTDERGNIGVGEASPLPGYSPDDASECPRILSAFASRLDHAPDHVGEIDAWLTKTATIPTNAPASRFAVETAILDLVSQRANMPLSVVLGGRDDARVAMNGVVGASGDVDRWVEEARDLVERNIRVVKVKIGRSSDFRRELHELAVVRALLPPDVELRLDANGSLADDVRGKMTRLSPLRASFVEEPVRGDALLAIDEPKLRWAADESLVDVTFAPRALESAACAAIVLKPAILGGILRSHALAQKARGRGIGVVVTHIFDGDVAHAATCALALSLESPLACGLDRHAGMRSVSPHLAIPGFVTATQRIGVGAAA